jgi:hypothetical protein
MSPLTIVISAGTQPWVEVKGVAVLEVLGGADAADRVPPRRSDVGQPKDAALKLDIREQMGQAEVLQIFGNK